MKLKKAAINDVKEIVGIWEKFLSEHDEIVETRNPNLKSINLKCIRCSFIQS